LLERDFFIVFCIAPPQAGRDVQRNKVTAQIPESEGCAYCDSSGLSACKGPTGEVQGMSERSDEIPLVAVSFITFPTLSAIYKKLRAHIVWEHVVFYELLGGLYLLLSGTIPGEGFIT